MNAIQPTIPPMKIRHLLEERGHSYTQIAKRCRCVSSLVSMAVSGVTGQGLACRGKKTRRIRHAIAELLGLKVTEIWPGEIEIRRGRPAKTRKAA
jgi:lambda repressor-like predicted transcriptional regulator